MHFNIYFSTIGTDLANSIATVGTSFETFLSPPLCHSFVLFPITATEIEEEINKLNPSKSTGLLAFLRNY